MGGLGSGREAYRYSGTVEGSLQLDVNRLVRDGTIRQGNQGNGVITWAGLRPSSVGYEVQCFIENGYIRLQYTVSRMGWEDRVLNYSIELYTTKPHFGGVRWWFICPNEECEKMVTKLYQPSGAYYFLCRKCNNLTYQSCRDSGKYDSLYKQMALETGLSLKAVKRVYRQLRHK